MPFVSFFFFFLSFVCFCLLFILNAFSQRLKVRRLNLSYIQTYIKYMYICLLFCFIHSQRSTTACVSISSAKLGSSSMLMMTKDTVEYHRRFLLFLISFLCCFLSVSHLRFVFRFYFEFYFILYFT